MEQLTIPPPPRMDGPSHHLVRVHALHLFLSFLPGQGSSNHATRDQLEGDDGCAHLLDLQTKLNTLNNIYKKRGKKYNKHKTSYFHSCHSF